MSKKFCYYILALVILIVTLILLPSEKGYWTGDYTFCWSEDQCECGASGYVSTKSLGFIEIPYAFESCASMHPDLLTEAEKEQIRQAAEEKKKAKWQALLNSCDPGWIMINGHCVRCDSLEVYKISEVDCLKCNRYELVRIYDPQSGECRLKE